MARARANSRRGRLAGAVSLGVLVPALCAQPSLDPAHPLGLLLDTGNAQTIVLNEAHGGIVEITDAGAGTPLDLRNLYGPWLVRYVDGHWMDADSFGAGNPLRVSSWSWDAGVGELEYHLVSTDAHPIDVRYLVDATETDGFGFTLTITNTSGQDIELAAFPVHLSMPRTEIDYALLPYIEGVELRKSFFDASTVYSTGYPGAMFADYAYFSIGGQPAAVYFRHDPGVDLKPSLWQLLYNAAAGDVTNIHHDFIAVIGPGETWVSPELRIVPNADRAASQAMYWAENAHDQQPTLEQKLDPALADRLAGAVLFKRDFYQSFQTFAAFEAFLPQIPRENLLHPVVFWPRGFDENYPDYLPTDPALGSTAGFAALVETAQTDYGHLVMPYTNPTWWDDEAPTYQNLGPGISALDLGGSAIWETYAGTHTGIVVSPHHPDVIARQDQTRDEFTQIIPCDFLFEDQLGARSGLIDTNGAAPSRSAYTQGLIDIAARTSQSIPAWTESGFDRLTAHEIAFCNSIRVGWHTWPDSTWRSFPLSPLWARDRLVFTAHNLAAYTMTNDYGSMVEQLASGYSLSYSIVPPIDSAWVAYLDAVQKRVVAPLFGLAMTDFRYDAEGVSTTTFADGAQLVANRNGGTLGVSDHALAGEGFLITDAGGFRAGRVTRVNGAALAGGVPHTIALTDSGGATRIDHPEGPQTTLVLTRDGLGPGPYTLTAVLTDGSTTALPVIEGPLTVSIPLPIDSSGQPASHFLLSGCVPDLNGDGILDNGDIQAFLALFLGGDLGADLNGDGILDNGDIQTFLTPFLAGCA